MRGIGTRSDEDRMRRHERIEPQAEVGVHARPVVQLGRGRDRVAHGIEFDLAIDHQQVTIAVDEAGLEATFAQRARLPMPAIERLHIGLAVATHGLRQRAGALRAKGVESTVKRTQRPHRPVRY